MSVLVSSSYADSQAGRAGAHHHAKMARASSESENVTSARRDVETQAAVSRKTDDDAAQLKQAAGSAAELRQSLQQEHDRAEALAGDKLFTRRVFDGSDEEGISDISAFIGPQQAKALQSSSP